MKKVFNIDSYLYISRYVSLFGGVQVLNVLIGIVRNKFVATLLGSQGVRLISPSNSTVKLINDPTNFGISVGAVRNISEDYDQSDEEKLTEGIALVRSWSLLATLSGFFICAFLSPLLSRYTFAWDGRTFHFTPLSPCVALTALTGGELAILKGVRRLRVLVAAPIYNALSALVLTVPLHHFLGNTVIVPSLVLVALMQLLLTIMVSRRLYPFRVSFQKMFLDKGWGMICLGMTFVFAGILGFGADLIMHSYLSNVSDTTTVGFYDSAFIMTMVYAGMIFSAVETDHFPRLSGANNSKFTLNQIVNRQIEVALLLISPLPTFFLLLLLQLVLFLYSDEFLPALSMAQMLVLVMYVHAIRLPVEYILLAKGDSKSYLPLEGPHDIFPVALVLLGFWKWGLFGTGMGIVGAGLLSLVYVYGYAYARHSHRLSSSVMCYATLHFSIGLFVLLCVRSDDEWMRWGVVSLLHLVGTIVSLRMMKAKSGLWNALVSKVRNKFVRHAKD